MGGVAAEEKGWGKDNCPSKNICCTNNKTKRTLQKVGMVTQWLLRALGLPLCATLPAVAKTTAERTDHPFCQQLGR